MIIYTENDTESHRNIQNINIYPKTYSKHEKCVNFQNIQTDQKSIFPKTIIKQMLILMALLIFYVEGNTA